VEIHRSIAARIGADSSTLFELGMMFATGHLRALNLVSAHVCFNLAGRQGHDRAPKLRQEIAAEMSADEIAAAQRTARGCLSASISEVLGVLNTGWFSAAASKATAAALK
jgi:hypothetical protein